MGDNGSHQLSVGFKAWVRGLSTYHSDWDDWGEL